MSDLVVVLSASLDIVVVPLSALKKWVVSLDVGAIAQIAFTLYEVQLLRRHLFGMYNSLE